MLISLFRAIDALLFSGGTFEEKPRAVGRVPPWAMETAVCCGAQVLPPRTRASDASFLYSSVQTTPPVHDGGLLPPTSLRVNEVPVRCEVALTCLAGRLALV